MAVADNEFDIVIVGGGLVGASLACALRDLPLRVAVVEAHRFDQQGAEIQPSFDTRTVALAHVSKQIFSALGLWDAVLQKGAAPIRHIHVSDRGHLGQTRLAASDYGQEALGYVVENRILGQVFAEQWEGIHNVNFLCPAQLTSVSFSDAGAELGLDVSGRNQTLRTRLLVAADGGESRVRELCGIDVFRMGYRQTAVVANLRTDKPHNDVAYERFTDQGPIAFLPLAAGTLDVPRSDQPGCDYSLVWTQPDDQVHEVAELEDATFMQRLQDRFGRRAGNIIQVGSRFTYPLGMMQVREQVRPRLAIIGNAAHTVHPVAGQGFNLGLRDVAVLSQVIAQALSEEANADPGNLRLLQHYARWRQRDRLQTGLITDGLVRTFSNNMLPLAAARNLGLIAMDVFPPLKRLLARQAMGYVGRLPRLARGLSLTE